MEKREVLEKIEACGVVAVVRADGEEQTMRVIDACVEGGVTAIEATFTIPYAHEIIAALSRKYDVKDVLIGAGTVLDEQTARIAILEGAQFVVSPYLRAETVKTCLRYQIACIPGAMTVKEAAEVMESGADMIKLFPADIGGPKMIKNIKGPLPQARIMPTGGVTADNCGAYIAAGAAVVGAGSDLTAGAKTGDYARVTAIAKKMIDAVKTARGL